ncbi:hypothetical protein BD560DRAFT_419841 [Blakeslea trispora]|nr:hypothetical protein BD560DRAFT_419841 [Blakeslea trispora]
MPLSGLLMSIQLLIIYQLSRRCSELDIDVEKKQHNVMHIDIPSHDFQSGYGLAPNGCSGKIAFRTLLRNVICTDFFCLLYKDDVRTLGKPTAVIGGSIKSILRKTCAENRFLYLLENKELEFDWENSSVTTCTRALSSNNATTVPLYFWATELDQLISVKLSIVFN